jgi:multidrug efflux pump subunit AcrA (membrane-fusion protein)
MDLNRLKIPDKPAPSRKGGRATTVALCLVCAAGGFFASKGFEHLGPNRAVEVRTAVARSASGGQGKGFTAGGWIEPAWPKYPVLVSARIPERIEELLAVEGRMVEPGETIVRLYDKDMRNHLEIAQTRVAEARENLGKLEAGYRKEEITAAEAKVAERAEALRLADANYKRDMKLTRNTISERELDASLSAYAQATALHALAQADLEKLRAGYRPEDIAIARTQVDKAGAEVELARNNLEACVIGVPAGGPALRVLKIYHQVGDWIPEKEDRRLVALYDPQDMQARVDVTQANISHVRVGGRTRIVTEADSRSQYSGTVLRIDPQADLAKNTVTIRVRIDNPDEMLFPDMVAQVTFLVEDAPDEDKPAGLVVPREAVRSDEGGDYVFVVKDGQARRRDVAVEGARGDQTVLRGELASGQRVIVSHSERLADGTPVTEP